MWKFGAFCCQLVNTTLNSPHAWTFIVLFSFILNSLLATYEVMAPEDLSEGSSILQVTANDEDSGKNSKLTYSIVDTTILPNSLLDDVDPSVRHTVCDSITNFIFSYFFRLLTPPVCLTSLHQMVHCSCLLVVISTGRLWRDTVCKLEQWMAGYQPRVGA